MMVDRVEIVGGRFDGLRGERIARSPFGTLKGTDRVEIKGEDGKLYIIKKDDFERLSTIDDTNI